jgi:hypothetical protein
VQRISPGGRCGGVGGPDCGPRRRARALRWLRPHTPAGRSGRWYRCTMLLCPGCACTVFRSIPAQCARLAAPCRRSRSRAGGSPYSPTRWWNRRVRKSGCGGPSSATNTYPESCHAPSDARCSARCRRWCSRSSRAVCRSSATRRRLAAILGRPTVTPGGRWRCAAARSSRLRRRGRRPPSAALRPHRGAGRAAR